MDSSLGEKLPIGAIICALTSPVSAFSFFLFLSCCLFSRHGPHFLWYVSPLNLHFLLTILFCLQVHFHVTPSIITISSLSILVLNLIICHVSLQQTGFDQGHGDLLATCISCVVYLYSVHVLHTMQNMQHECIICAEGHGYIYWTDCLTAVRSNH